MPLKILQFQIRSAHRPLTNLMANKELKLASFIRTERLLEFINSEHAGFRCASLFLVRKDVTMEVRVLRFEIFKPSLIDNILSRMAF